jgi:hypothetical protein
VSAQIIPFNPLEKQQLGNSVADALLKSTPHPMDRLSPFYGAGVYALYYSGQFKAYSRLAAQSTETTPVAIPIYVGKAVPAGGRKGTSMEVDPKRTTSLYKRLSEHAESIRAASNLSILDFSCRYLVVDDIWIPLGESLLIAKFSPLWNNVVDGFGNHDPGGGRYNGLRPRWDTLHPGRAWAAKCKPRKELAHAIEVDVMTYLSTHL